MEVTKEEGNKILPQEIPKPKLTYKKGLWMYFDSIKEKFYFERNKAKTLLYIISQKNDIDYEYSENLNYLYNQYISQFDTHQEPHSNIKNDTNTLNKALKRRIIGSLTCVDDGSIHLYSQPLLEQIILQGESHISQTKKSLDLNNNIKKAQLSLDQKLQKLQQRIDHAVNIYGPLYTLMANRYEYNNMDFKRRKDYQRNDSEKYYWWPSPDINNTELSASYAIKNRGFLGEVYTSYILDRKDVDLRLASIHINNSIYTKRQNPAIQSALGSTNKYVGSQDDLPGIAQGDVSIIFNGTRIQIAVKSQTLISKKYNSEALGPIIAMATLIITYKEKNYTDLATLLCELFYQDFLNNKTMTTGERLLNVAIKKANKIFNESMTTPSIII